MSKAPDVDELARRYLELWQNQFAAMAADPDFAESMGRMFSLMGAAASGSAPDAANPKPRPDNAAQPNAAEPAAPAGAAAAGAASRGGGDDVADLARRVAELEERLAAVEGRKGKSGGARRKPRKS